MAMHKLQCIKCGKLGALIGGRAAGFYLVLSCIFVVAALPCSLLLRPEQSLYPLV